MEFILNFAFLVAGLVFGYHWGWKNKELQFKSYCIEAYRQGAKDAYDVFEKALKERMKK